MRFVHGCDEKVVRVQARRAAYHPGMLSTVFPQTRTLTLVLDESDWHALREAEPDAVGWLQSQIRNRLTSVRPAQAEPAGAADYSVEDDY